MKIAAKIALDAEQRVTLTKWSRGRNTPAKLVLRAKIVLLAAEGRLNKEIAAELQTTPATVSRWRRRFAEGGVEAIRHDASRPGRPRTISPEYVSEILRKTTQEKPIGHTHWSCRSMAKAVGVSPATVQRIWAAHNLKPHRVKTFKVSQDPQFEEKLVDVVGLYLNPPDQAVVLCVDEKSQIQALQRTQKSLPMYPGRNGTLTHDYQRNGTTTLFAALNTLDGTVLADFHQRHRHQEWLKFLKLIARAYPTQEIHIICDNYGTHKHPKVRRWLTRHPRIHVHLTPTSSSWLNLVERWFRELNQKCLKRGSFRHVAELEAAIWEFINECHEQPHRFCWRAEPDAILAKVARARQALDKPTSN